MLMRKIRGIPENNMVWRIPVFMKSLGRPTEKVSLPSFLKQCMALRSLRPGFNPGLIT